jgi:hypothetical protein
MRQQPLFNLRPEPPAAHSLGRFWKARLHPPRRHGETADLIRQAQFARDLLLGEVGRGHFSLASSSMASIIRRPTMAATLTGLPLPPLFSVLAPGAISTKECLQHVRYQRCGFDGFVEPAVLGRIGIELFLEKFRQHNGDLHRALLGQRTKFQINHSSYLPNRSVRIGDQVLQPWSAASPRSQPMIRRAGDPERMTVRITAVSIPCRRGNRRDHASRSTRDIACCSLLRMEAARVRHMRKAPAKREGGR